MYEQVVACITKPPSQRTNEEVENLFPWFVLKANAFQNLKPGKWYFYEMYLKT